MRIDIYETSKRNTFIAVETGGSVPDKVHSAVKVETRPMKTVDAVTGRSLIGLDPTTVLADIKRDGFAVFGAEVKTTETE